MLISEHLHRRWPDSCRAFRGRAPGGGREAGEALFVRQAPVTLIVTDSADRDR